MENNKKKSVLFTTTVREDALKEFKEVCKKKGMPMSIILTAFMEGYVTDYLIKENEKKNKKNTKKENKEVIA